MNRRDFLKKLTIATTLTSFANFTPSFGVTQASTEAKTPERGTGAKKAVVMGGGLSGLYSAYILKQSGYEVTVIERADRLGGRIFTYQDKNLGIVQDLGAEWIGEGQSDIKSLLKQLGLTLKPAPHTNKFSLKNTDGGSLLKISSASTETLEKVIELHKSLSPSQKQGLDKTNFSAYVRYQGLTEEEVLSLSETYRIFFGKDLNQISSAAVLNDLSSQESGLKPAHYISGGAEKLISSMKASLGSDTEYSLGDPIIKVNQMKNYAQVELASGKILKANVIICTLPPSAIMDIKWNPSLPKDVVYSVLQMQSGKISKNILLCKKKDAMSPSFQITDSPAQALYVSNEEAIGEHSYILTSLTTGDRAALFEKGSESQKRALIKLSIQELKPIEHLEIGENPFYFHSFQKSTGQSGFVSVFQPGSLGIKDPWFEPYERVFFAGEHLANQSR